MSSPISGSSSPNSQKSTADNILSPGHRVKALLAQFEDSDSEEENSSSVQKPSVLPLPESKPTSLEADRPSESEGDEEDNVLPLVPRGRLAARLQTKGSARHSNASSEDDSHNAYQRVKEQLQQAKTNTSDANDTQTGKPAEWSEDELSKPAPRRMLLHKKANPTQRSVGDSVRTRSASPLFFPSPSATRNPPATNHVSAQSDSDDLPQGPASGGRSKFLALVEKHRKQRLAKEAAEIAKKAARAEQYDERPSKTQLPRGSSPLHGSAEDNDTSEDGAGKRLTQKGRPARGASRRALEEMDRESQRMNRNRQLAHQARTRKKITKESLLARFNFPIPGALLVQEGKRSSTASSAPTSDIETGKDHITPPTSPLQEGTPEKATNNLQTSMNLDYTAYGMRDGDLPSLGEIVTEELPKLDKGKGRAVEASPKPGIVAAAKKEIRPIRVRWSKQDVVMARGGDSDSDLEIITSQSRTRKYAAFENLPKRSAKEKQSHIALRSLAHLVGGHDKNGPSMNAAEMELSLRRAAREQARLERQEKIEELKARGVTVQTAEERERNQQEVEDIVERARQEAAEIQKRERAVAKKDGTFVKDGLADDSDDEEDGDFQDAEAEADQEAADASDSEEQDDEDGETGGEDEGDGGADLENEEGNLIDQEADEEASDEESEELEEEVFSDASHEEFAIGVPGPLQRNSRNARVVMSDDEEEEANEVESLALPAPVKTPQSLPRSARKIIPGLQMSDDFPMGLTQAFAATMADSQTQDVSPDTQEQDTLAVVRDLPSPMLPFAPKLNRLDSIDIVSDSQPASQTQPLNISLSFSQSQTVPQSPLVGLGISVAQFTPSQLPFEPTQDAGYLLSPFAGSRFDAATPQHQAPRSTVDTVILPNGADDSPIVQRKSRLRKGRAIDSDEEEISELNKQDNSAFAVMRRAAKQKAAEPAFDKTKSAAKAIIDEAAEESEDEYAGLGGASDDDAGEENEDDRKMIDEDTQVGRGDEAKLAGLFADRERKQDEAAVSKLMKDLTTGALRRKRGAGDDLDLSDEEDAATRRREAKRREFAKMRRELLKDEAVGKIAEDQKKEAFLRSIEDRDEADDDDADLDEQEMPVEDESQSQSQQAQSGGESQHSIALKSQNDSKAGEKHKMPLEALGESSLNRLPATLRRTTASVNKRPATLAEIRESVSFLIDEPDSQSANVDLGLSDSEDDPETYVDLDRHLNAADENAEDDDAEDLGDFIVDDDEQADIFKKPELPRRESERPSFNERRTKARANVVDRLQLLRQSSSSSASSNGSGGAKMAFFTSKSSSTDSLFGKVPALLRRATTNSSFGSMAGRGEEVSATGVVTGGNRTERGEADQEKEFVRKGSGGRRNAVNYTAREKPAEAMSRRAGVVKKSVAKRKGKGGGKGGFLGGLFGGNSWG